MRDICDMVQAYLARTAVSFTFDSAGSVWILWRGADGDLYYGKRGMPRSECVDIGEYSGYARCEIDYHNDKITVAFCWDDRTLMDHYVTSTYRFPNTSVTHDHMLIWQPYCRFREFYIFAKGRRCESYGISHPWPEQYVTIRCFSRRLYGMTPCGDIEIVPHPEWEKCP